MTFEEFQASLEADRAPEGAGPLLTALWFEARGGWQNSDWERAHTIVQAEQGPQAAEVHAYLHRREGDLPNAAYWYRRAGMAPRDDDMQVEWAELVRAQLASWA